MDHLGVGIDQQMPGFHQAQLRLLVAEGLADLVPEKPAEMANTAVQ
jgi:hypothetical protein